MDPALSQGSHGATVKCIEMTWSMEGLIPLNSVVYWFQSDFLFFRFK